MTEHPTRFLRVAGTVIGGQLRLRRSSLTDVVGEHELVGTGSTVEWLDADGAVLGSAQVQTRTGCSFPQGSVTSFRGAATHIPDAAAVRLTVGQAETVVDASAPPPRVILTDAPSPGERVEREVRLGWEHDAPGPVQVAARISVDAGTTFETVALQRESVEATTGWVDLSGFGGQSECVLELMVSAGVATTLERSEVFAIADQPTALAIRSPLDGAAVASGTPILLDVLAQPGRDGVLTDLAPRWTSSVQGELGVGARIEVQLDIGDHVITVEHGVGPTAASASVNVQVR